MNFPLTKVYHKQLFKSTVNRSKLINRSAKNNTPKQKEPDVALFKGNIDPSSYLIFLFRFERLL